MEQESTVETNEIPLENTGDLLAKTALCAFAGFAVAKLINLGYDAARVAIATRNQTTTTN